MAESLFKKGPQGFVIIDMNHNSPTRFQPTDACVQFEFLGHEISCSTGGSILSGACLVEHLVTDPEGRAHMIRGTVQDAIMFVIQREHGSNIFCDAMGNEIEEV